MTATKQTGAWRAVINGAGALLIIQVANMVLPLLLVPYLVSVLGVELYGVAAFALAMVLMAGVVTDYGFTLSATYQVAKLHDTESGDLNAYCSAVLICKLFLTLPVILTLIVFVKLDAKYLSAHALFVWLILPIIGQSLQPLWFFQGIERMTFVTWCTVGSKLLYVLTTFLLVKGPGDLVWIGIAQGLGAAVSATIGLYLMLVVGWRPKKPSRGEVAAAMRAASPFFFSRAAVMSYTSGATFVLGILGSPLQLGLYAAAEQFYKAGQAVLGSLSQSLYPRMVRSRDVRLFRNMFTAGLVITFVGAIGGVLLGPVLLPLILGRTAAAAYGPFCAFMAALLCVGPSMLIGYPLLAAFGYVREANRSVLVGAFIQVCAVAVLWRLQHVNAATIALSVFLTEAVVLAYRVAVWRRADLT